MAVGKSPLLQVINRPPPQGDVYAACDADLVARMLGMASRVSHVAVARRSPSTIRRRRSRCSAIPCLSWCSGYFRRRGHLIGLANSTSQGKVCLLEILDVELKGIQPCLAHDIMNSMNNRLGGGVLFAPKYCRHDATLAVDSDNVKLISPGALDRSNIESENMPLLASAFNVIRCTTLMAGHTCPTFLITGLADFVILCSRDRWDSLRWFHCLGVTELDFGGPYGAGDVHPIVVSCTLERLAGVDWAIHLFLLLAVVFSSFAGLLNFHLFSLAVFLRHLFLVVCEFRQLNEIMFSLLNRTQDTFVLLHTEIVSTELAA